MMKSITEELAMMKTVHYLFDPLCGWCYSAKATLSARLNASGITVELMPIGLFSGSGARTMDANPQALIDQLNAI